MRAGLINHKARQGSISLIRKVSDAPIHAEEDMSQELADQDFKADYKPFFNVISMEHKLPTENSNWLSTMAPSLQKETFEQLMNFQLPALKIEQFATQEECDAMVKALDARQFGFSEMQSPPIGRIGITQFSFSKSSPEQYFSDLPRQHDDVEAVFAESFNPVQRILEHLQEVWPHSDVSIASCPKHRNAQAFMRSTGSLIQLTPAKAPNTWKQGFDKTDRQLTTNHLPCAITNTPQLPNIQIIAKFQKSSQQLQVTPLPIALAHK